MTDITKRLSDIAAAAAPAEDHQQNAAQDDRQNGHDPPETRNVALAVCPICNTPTQARIFFKGIPHVVNCLCQCKAAQRDKAQAADEARQKRIARETSLDRLAASGLVEPRSGSPTFDDDDGSNPKATAIVMGYVDHFDAVIGKGKGLLLYGGVGTGKTFLAQCAVNALARSGYFTAMTSFPRIERALWNSPSRQNDIDALTHFDLLAIDDLFAERDTDYMTEKTYAIIDALLKAKTPIIVTTNLTQNDLADKSDISRARILSRLYEACIFVQIGGEDRREAKSRADRKAFSELIFPENKITENY